MSPFVRSLPDDATRARPLPRPLGLAMLLGPRAEDELLRQRLDRVLSDLDRQAAGRMRLPGAAA